MVFRSFESITAFIITTNADCYDISFDQLHIFDQNCQLQMRAQQMLNLDQAILSRFTVKETHLLKKSEQENSCYSRKTFT